MHPASASNSVADDAASAFLAFRDGDRRRLADLVALLTPVLWRVARAQGADRDTAEDAVQNTWLHLVDKADDIREPQAVLAWLIVTVRREVRRSSSYPATADEEELGRLCTPAPGPEATALLNERQRLLWDHVEKLSPVCRHLLFVIAFAGRPGYATMANSLGIPVGSIGPTRGRCLHKLRAALANDPRWKE